MEPLQSIRDLGTKKHGTSGRLLFNGGRDSWLNILGKLLNLNDQGIWAEFPYLTTLWGDLDCCRFFAQRFLVLQKTLRFWGLNFKYINVWHRSALPRHLFTPDVFTPHQKSMSYRKKKLHTDPDEFIKTFQDRCFNSWFKGIHKWI